MNVVMIERWNMLIKPDDLVYHLGDFCMGRKMNDAEQFFSKLNGKVNIVAGNHDAWMVANAFFPNTKNSYVQKIEQQYTLSLYNEKIVLSHYPMRSWDASHYGSWHLYGHVHGAYSDYGLSMDVGVDTNNFNPYSFEQIKEIMKIKKKEQKDYVIFDKKL